MPTPWELWYKQLHRRLGVAGNKSPATNMLLVRIYSFSLRTVPGYTYGQGCLFFFFFFLLKSQLLVVAQPGCELGGWESWQPLCHWPRFPWTQR